VNDPFVRVILQLASTGYGEYEGWPVDEGKPVGSDGFPVGKDGPLDDGFSVGSDGPMVHELKHT
jgi:hypothetical protein